MGNEVPERGVHYTCIVCITIHSVMKMEKKLSTSLFRKMSEFIDAQLELDCSSDSEL